MSATCDLVKYECDTQVVSFHPTMMFTTRTHEFKVKNSSTVTMDYDNQLVAYKDRLQEQAWNPGYYSISPKKGAIKPGCDELFTLKFQPTEVELSN